MKMWVLALSVATIGVLGVQDAQACGGFFCSNQAPVQQAGERILFSVDGSTVTAHIQIQYQGQSQDFSWVLPVPTVPEFGVGTDTLFSQLHNVTDPQLVRTWNANANCRPPECPSPPMQDVGMSSQDSMMMPSSRNDEGGVEVVKEGQVGAFEYKVLEAESGEVLYQWLEDNEYDLPEDAKPLVEYYVNVGFVFVALKLEKTALAGDLQPVVLKYETPDLACVPLRLTSIAVAPDMPVFLWVLGEARSVPLNWFHVQLNPKTINWLNCTNQFSCLNAYMNVVTDAIDVAAGRGFVTEYAGDSGIMDDRLYMEGQYDLSNATRATDFWAFQAQVGFLPNQALVQAILAKYNEEGKAFDAKAAAAELQERVIQPLIDAQQLFSDHAYLTRMLTTVSADDMTRDPLFSFNPTLPHVDRRYEVQAEYICHDGSNESIAGIQLTYPNGGSSVIKGEYITCQGFIAEEQFAAPDELGRVEVIEETGAPEPVAPGDIFTTEATIELRTPNLSAAGAVHDANVSTHFGAFYALEDEAKTFAPGPAPIKSSSGSSSSGGSASRGGGCSTGGSGGGAAPFLVLGLALLLCVRRREAVSH